jgi:hypothetical protein
MTSKRRPERDCGMNTMDRNRPLATLIAQFRREFETFDERCVNAALASLTADAALLDQAQLRLTLHARLTLVKRLVMARADKASLELLDRLIERTIGLQQKYDELTRYSSASTQDRSTASPSLAKIERPETRRVWLPTMIEIYDSIEETRNLERTLQAFVEIQTVVAAGTSPIGGDNRVHNSTFSPVAY